MPRRSGLGQRPSGQPGRGRTSQRALNPERLPPDSLGERSKDAAARSLRCLSEPLPGAPPPDEWTGSAADECSPARGPGRSRSTPAPRKPARKGSSSCARVFLWRGKTPAGLPEPDSRLPTRCDREARRRGRPCRGHPASSGILRRRARDPFPEAGPNRRPGAVAFARPPGTRIVSGFPLTGTDLGETLPESGYGRLVDRLGGGGGRGGGGLALGAGRPDGPANPDRGGGAEPGPVGSRPCGKPAGRGGGCGGAAAGDRTAGGGRGEGGPAGGNRSGACGSPKGARGGAGAAGRAGEPAGRVGKGGPGKAPAPRGGPGPAGRGLPRPLGGGAPAEQRGVPGARPGELRPVAGRGAGRARGPQEGGRGPDRADPRIAPEGRREARGDRAEPDRGLQRDPRAAQGLGGDPSAPAPQRDRQPGQGPPAAGGARPVGRDAAPPGRRDGGDGRAVRLPRAGERGGGSGPAAARPGRPASRGKADRRRREGAGRRLPGSGRGSRRADAARPAGRPRPAGPGAYRQPEQEGLLGAVRADARVRRPLPAGGDVLLGGPPAGPWAPRLRGRQAGDPGHADDLDRASAGGRLRLAAGSARRERPGDQRAGPDPLQADRDAGRPLGRGRQGDRAGDQGLQQGDGDPRIAGARDGAAVDRAPGGPGRGGDRDPGAGRPLRPAAAGAGAAGGRPGERRGRIVRRAGGFRSRSGFSCGEPASAHDSAGGRTVLCGASMPRHLNHRGYTPAAIGDRIARGRRPGRSFSPGRRRAGLPRVHRGSPGATLPLLDALCRRTPLPCLSGRGSCRRRENRSSAASGPNPGRLDGIETGARRLIREEPPETTAVDYRGEQITIPAEAEIPRIETAWILWRNATRDCIDFLAFADRMGAERVAEAIFDRISDWEIATRLPLPRPSRDADPALESGERRRMGTRMSGPLLRESGKAIRPPPLPPPAGSGGCGRESPRLPARRSRRSPRADLAGRPDTKRPRRPRTGLFFVHRVHLGQQVDVGVGRLRQLMGVGHFPALPLPLLVELGHRLALHHLFDQRLGFADRPFSVLGRQLVGPGGHPHFAEHHQVGAFGRHLDRMVDHRMHVMEGHRVVGTGLLGTEGGGRRSDAQEQGQSQEKGRSVHGLRSPCFFAGCSGKGMFSSRR
ncbi:protein of unknown function [Methylacidimicrobium sp. AP8]|nr:protein of unknown function [Methylacidimicrobium sp. AP8]